MLSKEKLKSCKTGHEWITRWMHETLLQFLFIRFVLRQWLFQNMALTKCIPFFPFAWMWNIYSEDNGFIFSTVREDAWLNSMCVVLTSMHASLPDFIWITIGSEPDLDHTITIADCKKGKEHVQQRTQADRKGPEQMNNNNNDKSKNRRQDDDSVMKNEFFFTMGKKSARGMQ